MTTKYVPLENCSREITIGDEVNMMEYIITLANGKKVRMLLDADEYEEIEYIKNRVLLMSRVSNVCDYGSKLLDCVGA